MHCGPASRQLDWVEQDLSSVNRSRTPWVVLMGHRQMYGSSYNCPFGPWQVCCVDDASLCRGDNALEPLLLRFKVDLCLWGHVHFAELSCAMYNGACVTKADADGYDAPVHAIIGNGGPQEPTAKEPAGWSRYLGHDNGFVTITAHNSSALGVAFYGDNPDVALPPPLNHLHVIRRTRARPPAPPPAPPPPPPPPAPPPTPPGPAAGGPLNVFPRATPANVSGYRIPLLLAIPARGREVTGAAPKERVLLAFAEGRITNGCDGGPKYVTMRRSTDAGRSSGRARSHGRFVIPIIHYFIPDSRTYVRRLYL
jgi:hypothetical protein